MDFKQADDSNYRDIKNKNWINNRVIVQKRRWTYTGYAAYSFEELLREWRIYYAYLSEVFPCAAL